MLKNIGFLVAGLIIAYLITNMFPSVMFNQPDVDEKIIYKDSIVLIDTCFLKEDVKIDTSIRKSIGIVQENVKPVDKIVTDSTITLPSPDLPTIKSSFYEHVDDNLIIKEVIVHSGEIYKFDRYIELDTPYIEKTITREIVVGSDESIIKETEEVEVYQKYNRIHLTGFAQHYNGLYDTGIGLRYTTKNNFQIGADVGLTNFDNYLIRVNLGIPIIKFNKETFNHDR